MNMSNSSMDKLVISNTSTKYDYDSGFRGVKQIWHSLRKHFRDNAENHIENYTGKLLDRTCPGWIKIDAQPQSQSQQKKERIKYD
jgi:hypothetical protein